MQSGIDREVGEGGALGVRGSRALGVSVAAGLAALIYAAASSLAADKTPPPPPPQAPPEDPPRPRILYHEQSGGSIQPVAPPQGPGQDGRAPIAPPVPPVTSPPAAKAPAAKPAPEIARPPAPPKVEAPAPPPPKPRAAAVPKPRASARPAPALPAAEPRKPDAPLAAWDCDRPGPGLAAAAEAGNRASRDEALRILESLAVCESDAARISALERARSLLDRNTFASWIDREKARARGPQAEARFQRLAYDAALERLAESRDDPLARARQMDSAAGAGIVAYRDAPVAASLGWLWLEGGDPASASLWFQRARTWQPDSIDALRGLALAALRERDFDRALGYAEALPPAAEGRADMHREALLGIAQRDFRQERHAAALERFAAAEALGPLPRYARMQQAWSLARSGDRDRASGAFAALYREHRDLESAQGILASANGATRIDASIAATEPLATLLRARLADQAFNSRRFVEARGLDPERYGAIGAISAPQAALAYGLRDKSGERGLSRLHADFAPVLEAGWPVGDRAVVRASFERAELDAGSPAAGALVGSGAMPAEGSRIRATVDEARIGFRYEHGWILQAAVGRGPRGGELPARTLGSVEFAATPAWGQASIVASSAPVRESVLSYAGLRDPFGDASWGRVFRHGVDARVLWLTRAPWSVGARARFARLEGEGVESNRQETLEVSLGYDLRLADFSYAAVSVSAGSDEYRRNLSHFTLGHGGYFSPQRYQRLGAAFDFMTAENRPWMARGRIAAGLVDKRENATPFFPLSPDGRFYEGASDRGHDSALQLAAVAQVHPNVQLALAFSRGLSPQYRETQALLQVRVLFEPRRAVVSADLPSIRNE